MAAIAAIALTGSLALGSVGRVHGEATDARRAFRDREQIEASVFPSGVTPAARGVLDRVIAETGADTRPMEVGWIEYAPVLAEAVGGWLRRHARPLATLFHVPGWVLWSLGWLLLAVVVLTLGLMVYRLVAARRHRGTAPTTTVLESAARPPALTPQHWTDELDRRLAEGDPRRALAALWWWLACTLRGAEADPSWTTRELLQTAGRPDLAPEGRVLDRLTYGVAEPRLADVRSLARRLRQATA